MKKIYMIVILVLLISGPVHSSEEENLAPAISAVVMENLQAIEQEDIDAVMDTIHTQSPSFLNTKQQTLRIIENYDLHYELVSFKYIGLDGEYAIARTKQLTTKVSGPAFRNNQIDMLQVFRKENGTWKFWSQAILGVTYLGN